MMVMRLNVAAVAVCDVTSKPRRPGVTLTYMVFDVCCLLDVVNVVASTWLSEGTPHNTLTNSTHSVAHLNN